MDKKTKVEIENNLYHNIMIQIEPYLKPRMTVQEKVAAKEKAFPTIKKILNETLEKERNISMEQILQMLRKGIEGTAHDDCGLQHSLIVEMLDLIEKQNKDNELEK